LALAAARIARRSRHIALQSQRGQCDRGDAAQMVEALHPVLQRLHAVERSRPPFTLVEHEGFAIAPEIPLPRANPID
jgi:hypothetical protein